MTRSRKLDWILRVEILAFVLAAMIHAGMLVRGYEHQEAKIAETVIAAVLLVGLLIAGWWPRHARRAVLLAQGFALLGTLVGVFTIAIGVGPRTAPDVVYHLLMVALLVWGLRLALKWRTTEGADSVA